MKNVAIVGGGIIGLFSAYYLNRSGHRVTIFDQGDLTDNCSSGNAGMIVPSHIIPLAAPGMISKGIRWMFDSTSPFYIKPRINGNLLQWTYQFYKHATASHVQRSIPAIKEISLLSKALYQQMKQENEFDFGYQEKGLLMLYQTHETEKEEIAAAKLSNTHGVEAHVLTQKEIQELEPNVSVKARGGVYFPGDAHLIPHMLVKNLIVYLKEHGVQIISKTKITDFDVFADKILSVTLDEDEEQSFDEYILATGAWSPILTSRLALSMPMQGGKGYSFTLDNMTKNVNIPSILLEGRVAVTPFNSSLRFGGTMEINGTNRNVNMNRVRGIVDTIPKYYPDLKVNMPQQQNVWSGLRPCSPDGLPYIGRSSRFKNLIIATGHAMMGLSLAPATGKIIDELAGNKSLSMSLSAFNPDRYN
jgi:D-amino-acid dehydrogenase